MGEVKLFFAPVANVTIGKKLHIKGRGSGFVRGILTTNYDYLTSEGESAHIDRIFRVCLQFYDDQEGACLDRFRPTQFFLVKGWGTYLPRGNKNNPWQTLQ